MHKEKTSNAFTSTAGQQKSSTRAGDSNKGLLPELIPQKYKPPKRRSTDNARPNHDLSALEALLEEDLERGPLAEPCDLLIDAIDGIPFRDSEAILTTERTAKNVLSDNKGRVNLQSDLVDSDKVREGMQGRQLSALDNSACVCMDAHITYGNVMGTSVANKQKQIEEWYPDFDAIDDEIIEDIFDQIAQKMGRPDIPRGIEPKLQAKPELQIKSEPIKYQVTSPSTLNPRDWAKQRSFTPEFNAKIFNMNKSIVPSDRNSSKGKQLSHRSA